MATATSTACSTQQPERHAWGGEQPAAIRLSGDFVIEITRETAQALLARGGDWRLTYLDLAGHWVWISRRMGFIELSVVTRSGLPDGGLRYTWFPPHSWLK